MSELDSGILGILEGLRLLIHFLTVALISSDLTHLMTMPLLPQSISTFSGPSVTLAHLLFGTDGPYFRATRDWSLMSYVILQIFPIPYYSRTLHMEIA
jgi:hypothetical protein